MKEIPVNKKLKSNESIYREGRNEGINFIANTILNLINKSTNDEKTKLNLITTFCKNTIKIHEDNKKEINT